MASSVTLTARIDAPDGSITFQFSDRSGLYFQDEQALINYCMGTGLDQSVVPDLKRYLISWSGRNGKKINKTATFDIASNAGNIVRIQ